MNRFVLECGSQVEAYKESHAKGATHIKIPSPYEIRTSRIFTPSHNPVNFDRHSKLQR